MNFDTEIKFSKPFGPWVLSAKLPEDVLNKMIEMADSLADDLKGKVLDENLQVLTEEKVQQYFEPVFTS